MVRAAQSVSLVAAYDAMISCPAVMFGLGVKMQMGGTNCAAAALNTAGYITTFGSISGTCCRTGFDWVCNLM
jgi:hypothetical protein